MTNPEKVPQAEEEDDLDPVEKLLKKSGCLELHYKVQECIADTKDWRRCQEPVNLFRKCIEDSKKKEPGS